MPPCRFRTRLFDEKGIRFDLARFRERPWGAPMSIPNSPFLRRRNAIHLGAISGEAMGCPPCRFRARRKEYDSSWRKTAYNKNLMFPCQLFHEDKPRPKWARKCAQGEKTNLGEAMGCPASSGINEESMRKTNEESRQTWFPGFHKKRLFNLPGPQNE